MVNIISLSFAHQFGRSKSHSGKKINNIMSINIYKDEDFYQKE